MEKITCMVCKPRLLSVDVPVDFPHGGLSGWHPDLKNATGHKITLAQWVTQLVFRKPRFEQMGPLVNEFLIDAFSCIRDQRRSFHAHNQEKYHKRPYTTRCGRQRCPNPAVVGYLAIGSSFHQLSPVASPTKRRSSRKAW